MSRENISVIIADDDLDDQHLVKSAISELPFSTTINAVYTGYQLLDLLLKKQAYTNVEGEPDVVFLDLNMPLLDGLHSLKEIRKHPQLQDLPIYILSTSRQEYDKERALEYGATGYITKPPFYEE